MELNYTKSIEYFEIKNVWKDFFSFANNLILSVRLEIIYLVFCWKYNR